MSHRQRRRVANTSLIRHREHRRMINKILQRHHRLQDRPQIVGAEKPRIPISPHRINIESDAPFPELEPRHFATGHSPNQLLIHLAERDLRRPERLHRRLHILRLEDEQDDLRFLRPEP